MNFMKWGVPDSREELAEGVACVSTPSHGGIVLSADRNRLVPKSMRQADGCYEEDIDWAIAWAALRKAGVIGDGVVLGNRDAREMDAHAEATIDEWRPDHVRALYGRDPSPDSRTLRAREDHAHAREAGWFMAVAATAAHESNAVPEGMVGAVLAPVHPEKDMPDRAREFHALIDEGLYQASRLESGLRLFDETHIIRIESDPWQKPSDELMSPAEAYLVALSWGSLTGRGEPGAIFYSFPFEDARPRNALHRRELVEYTRSCMEIAQERIRDDGRNPGPWACDDPHEELAQLKRLEQFFLRSEPLPQPEMDAPGV